MVTTIKLVNGIYEQVTITEPEDVVFDKEPEPEKPVLFVSRPKGRPKK